MSYKVNGKVYTDHALMDEIVYNCKIILNDIVIKNDVLANSKEDPLYMDEVEVFMMIKSGTINFSYFKFSKDILKAFGYSDRAASSILINKNNVPEEDRDRLVEFASNYVLDNYEEKNDYYRTLSGLPPYGTNEYNVYISETPAGYDKPVDFSRPVHEFDDDLLAVLQVSGKIDDLIDIYKGSNYSYLRFLGYRRIDIYTARKAGKYDILYMPAVEDLVQNRFIELYDINKTMYLNRTYSEAYAYSSDHYEQIMILMILAQTFNDIIVEVPEWYIRRDIFDIRSVQYFLESFGVAFYKIIPLKYQIRIVKSLNKLITYKSSNKNFSDILEIFSLKNTSIYKYYLYKKKLFDGSNGYDLEFIQTKINESYDDYINDLIYRTPYDDLTYEDKYWDGEDTHEYIKKMHLERDFTIEGTKYMSLEYKISMSEYLFQMQYFLGLLLDSSIDIDDIKIRIPSLENNVNFRLSDLFIFLFLLTLAYNNSDTDIIRPKRKDIDNYNEEFKKYYDHNGGYSNTPEYLYDTQLNGAKNGYSYLAADGGSNVDYSEIRSIEYFYDWMKEKFPELFKFSKEKVYGFNTKVSLEDIEEVISRRHSEYQFDHGFTLEELGVDNYIIPDKISTIDDLVTIYNNNKECYDTLKNKMVYDSDDRNEFKVLNYVFEQLFTKEFDYNFYKVNDKDVNSLDEILKERNFILYTKYMRFMAEKNLETRQDNIRDLMNDIINTLEYYLSYEGLDYIFSFSSISSFFSLVQYMHLMIKFFKSYKVYFLDPFVTYVADDRLENFSGGLDAIAEKRLVYDKWDKSFSTDNNKVISKHKFEEHYREECIMEVLDVYGHFEGEPDDDYDYDGMYASTNARYKDADGGKADDKSCIPYIMLNAGAASEGEINLWDLNGAGALEMKNTFVDIDGGYPFDYEETRTDYWNSAFKYIIDAGSASMNEFISKSIHTIIKDKQVSSEVRISKTQGNKLIVKDDGIYLEQIWTSQEDFNEFKDMFNGAYFGNIDKLKNGLDTVIIASSKELLDQRVKGCVDDTLSNMRRFVKYTDNDTLMKMAKEYTDLSITKLYEEFYGYNPYEWELF